METKNYTNLRKSKSDKNEYLLKVLPNGLKAMIVYDAEADKSAASLAVDIGSLAEPKEYPGLAHFCEHMLFMGTEKYPNEDDYLNYLNKHGGSHNAFTNLDSTQYYFDSSNDAFNEGLDRFAQFFIKPLFLQSTLDKEIKAVDSENTKNLLADNWRQMQLLRSEAYPTSLFNCFTTGNHETLNKPEVREQLLTFYNKYYSSEIMGLTVVTNQPLETMSKVVEELFMQVPKRDNFKMPIYDTVQPYDSNNLGYFYKVLPIKDSDTLTFIWYLPNIQKEYKKKPLGFWSSILGHEGPNSLTLSLTKDDLINSLGSMENHEAGIFSAMKIIINLTKKGLEQYEEVIKRVFKFLSILQKEKINKRYFDEVKQLHQMTFDNMNKQSPLTVATSISKHFQDYENDDLLTGPYLIEEYDESLIEKILKAMTPNNCNILFSSQKFKEECTSEEKWYGTKFTKAKYDYPSSVIEAYECKHPLSYPPENVFIPANLDLLPKPAEENEYPVIILKNNQTTLWHKQDIKFNLPKAVVKCKIYLDKDFNQKTMIYNEAISKIVNTIIKNELRDIIYQAEEANLHFSLNLYSSSITISLLGFSHSMKAAIKTFTEALMKIDYSDKEDTLKLQIQKEIQNYSNFYFHNGYQVAMSYGDFIMTEPSLTPSEILQEYLQDKELNITNLIKHIKEALKTAKYEWLIQGNISKEDAIEMTQICNTILNAAPLDTDSIRITRCYEIPSKTQYIYSFPHPNPKEQNSCIYSHFQCDHLVQREENILLVIESLLNDKFYNELRTNQGLGYTVFLFFNEYHGVQGLSCVVQSSVKCPEYISEQITIFFEQQTKVIENLTDEVFQTHVNAVLVQKKQKDKNINDETARNYAEILRHRFAFDKKKTDIEILSSLKKKELISFFKKHFVEEIKRVDIEYVAECHSKDNEAKHSELNDKEKNLTRIKVKSINDFKKRNTMHPDYFLINME